MKVIILNSGIGKRMGDLTKNNTKCLLKLNGETILGRQLKILKENNLKNIIITTGPFEEKIISYCKINFPELKIKYINNPVYDKTNYIHSIYLIKEKIESDILLLHGDLVFDEKIIKKIINKKESCSFIKRDNKTISKKDFKALIKENKIKKISTKIEGENTHDFMPLYKFKKEDFNLWMSEIEKFIEQGNNKCYAEDALNEILNEIKLFYIEYNKELFMEIDDINDLEKVKNLLK